MLRSSELSCSILSMKSSKHIIAQPLAIHPILQVNCFYLPQYKSVLRNSVTLIHKFSKSAFVHRSIINACCHQNGIVLYIAQAQAKLFWKNVGLTVMKNSSSKTISFVLWITYTLVAVLRRLETDYVLN